MENFQVGVKETICHEREQLADRFLAEADSDSAFEFDQTEFLGNDVAYH
jgi:hypothetical protein